MKVTIGIPFYNAERFLHLAIKSVLNQRFTDFELILSNDGSTDNSLKTALSFNDPRIKIITDGQNRGIAYRLNEQISMANGEYFARMDADDIMHPERIQIQYEHLRNDPMMDVVGSSAAIIDDNNKIIGYRNSTIHNDIEQVFRHVCFIHPTITGKTEWFKKYGYIESLKGVEDYDLWIRSFMQSSFYAIDKPLLFYRDPQKVKIETYRFRQKQLRLAVIKNKGIIGNRSFLLRRIIIESYLKEFIMVICERINLDSKIVSRRNIMPSDQMKDELQANLNEIIN